MHNKIMVTAHRPNRLGGYGSNPLQTWIRQELRNFLLEYTEGSNTAEAISGMAIGGDQWFAEDALAQCIPLHAYLPFPGQELRWPNQSQVIYRRILDKAATVNHICNEYSSGAFQARNIAMVDDATIAIAIWDRIPKGGTWNCLQYIKEQRLPTYWINPTTRQSRWAWPGIASPFNG